MFVRFACYAIRIYPEILIININLSVYFVIIPKTIERIKFIPLNYVQIGNFTLYIKLFLISPCCLY